MKQKVGFIGLGLMGGPMAANVARAGYPLTVYNRTPEKAAPLKELGAQVAASPREVAANSEVIITMLSDAAAVEGVLVGEDGVLAAARSGMVLIDMSTVAPDQSRHLADIAAERGMKMLDAPVLGSTGPAQEGTLIILVGGDRDVLEAHRDLLGTMGRAVHYMGPQGSGALAKLAYNLIVAAEVAALAEAMALVAKGGLDVDLFGRIIGDSPIASTLIQRKTQNMVASRHEAAFPLKHMHKDLGLMVRTAAALGVALPTTAVIHQLYTAARVTGHADEDFSAIYCLLASMAGMDV